MITRLQRISQDALASVPTTFVRPLYDGIDWDYPLSALLGTRGVGKTTLLLQRLKSLELGPEQAMYVDLGDVYFQETRLLDFAQEFRALGGRYLLIDEVHRYGYGADWAQELKQVYDLYRQDLTVSFTGSSAIQILQQKADLSRRVLQHRVPGLSFREYLSLKLGLAGLPVYDVLDVLEHSPEIVRELTERWGIKPLVHFAAYTQSGYYPYSLEGTSGYLSRLNGSVQLVLESDIPAVIPSGEADYAKLGRLLYAVASSVPFKPNITKLAERLSMSRETVVRYLNLLEDANLLINLRSTAKGVSALAKPDKIYLNNPNLLYALAPNEANLGTIRETFFINQLNYLTYDTHVVRTELRLPPAGDFLLLYRDRSYLFEVGGAGKTRQQIGQQDNAFAVVDTDVTDDKFRIPLWLFGFLY